MVAMVTMAVSRWLLWFFYMVTETGLDYNTPQLCVAVSTSEARVVINLLICHKSLQGIHCLQTHHTALPHRQTELLHRHTFTQINSYYSKPPVQITFFLYLTQFVYLYNKKVTFTVPSNIYTPTGDQENMQCYE